MIDFTDQTILRLEEHSANISIISSKCVDQPSLSLLNKYNVTDNQSLSRKLLQNLFEGKVLDFMELFQNFSDRTHLQKKDEFGNNIILLSAKLANRSIKH